MSDGHAPQRDSDLILERLGQEKALVREQFAAPVTVRSSAPDGLRPQHAAQWLPRDVQGYNRLRLERLDIDKSQDLPHDP